MNQTRQDLLRQANLIVRQLERRKQEALFQYVPDDSDGHDQLAFHKSPARIRLLLGGTGAGKTIVTMAEVAAAATGQSADLSWIGMPYKKPPIHVWIVKQSFPENVATDSVLRKLMYGDEYQDPVTQRTVFHEAFIHPRYEPTFNKNSKTITLKNGSTIQMKSAEQDVLQFASAGIDLIVVDEPIRTEVFQELFFRLIRREGARMMFALTPTGLAMGFLQDLMDQKDKSRVEFFYISTLENKYLDKEAVEHIASSLTEEQKETRLFGKPAMMVGLIYGEWEKNGCWIEPLPRIPDDWTRYVVHDPGYSNPAATLWGAVDPDGNIYLYRCQYDTSKSANVRLLIERMAATDDVAKIHRWYIDPFAASVKIPSIADMRHERNLKQLYDAVSEKYGFRWTMGPRQEEQAGRVQRITATKLYIQRDTNFPNIFAFDAPEMKPLRDELIRYRWAVSKGKEDRNEPDQPHKQHDHLMYCMETMCALPIRNIGQRYYQNDLKQDQEQFASSFHHMNVIDTEGGTNL